MNFTMNRDRVVVSKTGRSFEFLKGVPLHVPPMCYAEVMAAGGVSEEDIEEDKPPESVVPQGPERRAQIVAAMQAMVLKGERTDFTASGSPSAAVVSTNVGFAVDAKERDACWIATQAEAAE